MNDKAPITREDTHSPALSRADFFIKHFWLIPALLVAFALFVVLPFDLKVHDAVTDVLGGDIRRELAAWQQYGGITSIIVTIVVVMLLDPARKPQLKSLVLAALASAGLCWLIKNLVGRPRPSLNDPFVAAGPFGQLPIYKLDQWMLASSWDAGSVLWSFPSSHTAAAVVLSVWLTIQYPKLRWLALVMAITVAIARVVLGAHWPSDVFAGAAVGLFVAVPIVAGTARKTAQTPA